MIVTFVSFIVMIFNVVTVIKHMRYLCFRASTAVGLCAGSLCSRL